MASAAKRQASSIAANGAPKAPRIGEEEGQWECAKCGNVNYGTRLVCNMRKCGAARSEDPWDCLACGNSNYASRLFCNMNKCGVARPGLTMDQIIKGKGAGLGMGNGLPMAGGKGGYAPAYQPAYAPAYQPAYPPMPPAAPLSSSGAGAYPPAWACTLCGNQNFAGRASCNSRKCGALYEVAGGMYQPMAPMSHSAGGKGGFGGGDGNFPPAWSCMACGNSNFAGRPTCNSRKCGLPYPGGQPHRAPAMPQRPDKLAPEGSWMCTACSNVNFPSRTTCNAKNCGQPREMVDGGYPGSKNAQSAPAGSWTCPSCNNVNWPTREICNGKKGQCGAAKSG